MGSKTIRGKSHTSGSPRMQSPRLDGKISVVSHGELWERAYSMSQCSVLFPSRMGKQENQPNLPRATQKPEQQRFCEFDQQVEGQDSVSGLMEMQDSIHSSYSWGSQLLLHTFWKPPLWEQLHDHIAIAAPGVLQFYKTALNVISETPASMLLFSSPNNLVTTSVLVFITPPIPIEDSAFYSQTPTEPFNNAKQFHLQQALVCKNTGEKRELMVLNSHSVQGFI